MYSELFPKYGTSRRERINALIERRRLKVQTFENHIRIVGDGVDIIARRLDDVDAKDLLPEREQERHR